MRERKPFKNGVFKNLEIIKKYQKLAQIHIKLFLKNIIFLTKKWGIMTGEVLDLGTGTGLLAIEFAKRIPNVDIIGIDLSNLVLKVAQENIQKINIPLRISFRKGNIEQTPFKSDNFNLVISTNTLHLVKNPINMFNEIQRVLKPKGKFIISDLRRSWLCIFDPHISASYTPKEVKALLNGSKLLNWKIKDYFFWLNIFSIA